MSSIPYPDNMTMSYKDGAEILPFDPNPALSSDGESLNIAAQLLPLQGPWIGLRLYIVAPNVKSAKIVFGAITAVLGQFNCFSRTATTLRKQLDIAIEYFGHADAEGTSAIWPPDGPELVRRGTARKNQ